MENQMTAEERGTELVNRADEVTADKAVNDEVILFLAYTLETAVAEVQRAGKALGDQHSEQTWCSDQHWKTTVPLLPASQRE